MDGDVVEDCIIGMRKQKKTGCRPKVSAPAKAETLSLRFHYS